MERFFCGTEVVSGESALSALAQWRGERLLLLLEAGLQPPAALPFRQLRVFSVGREAGTAQAGAEGARLLRSLQPDLVVAMGSGPVLMTGKAALLLGKEGCPLVTIPTVPAAGEEVSPRVSLRHGMLRHTFAGKGVRPAMTILDPTLFAPCSRKMLAAAGFAILSDGLEHYVCPGGGMLGDLLAREAFCTARAALPGAVLGQPSSRQRLHMASVLAGMAGETAGVGLCSLLAQALADRYNQLPGVMQGILLPEILDWDVGENVRRWGELARAAGLGGATDRKGARLLREELVRLRRELGLPENLVRAGIGPEQVRSDAEGLTAALLEDPRLRETGLPVDAFMLRRLLERALGCIS